MYKGTSYVQGVLFDKYEEYDKEPSKRKNVFESRTFISILEDHILDFMEDYNLSPNGMIWEVLITQSLRTMGKSPNWRPNSHNPGTDIRIDGIDLQNKTLKIGAICQKKKIKGTINLSSYRTTSRSSLKEKLDYISSIKFDKYLLLAIQEDKINDKFIIRVWLVDYDLFDIPTIDLWKRKYKQKNNMNRRKCAGWKATKGEISWEIRKSMSDQLWIIIDENWLFDLIRLQDPRITQLLELEVPKETPTTYIPSKKTEDLATSEGVPLYTAKNRRTDL